MQQTPLDELLDTAPCGFATVDDDGQLVAVNRTLAELLGYSTAEIEGQRIELLLSVAGRIFYHSHVFPLLKLKERLDEIYLLLRPRSGPDLPVLVNATRRIREGVFRNDYVFVPMHQRSQYEAELLQAKQAAEAATRAAAAASAALQRANRALETRSASSQALAHATSEMELVTAVCRVIVETGGYAAATVSYGADAADADHPAAQAGTFLERGAAERAYGALLVLPIALDGRLLGRLQIRAAEGPAFDATETQLLAELASDLAYGITALRTREAHARAEAALAVHAAHLQVLSDASHEFARAGTDYQAVLERVVRTASEKLRATCVIGLRSAEDTALRLVAADADMAAQIGIALDDGGAVEVDDAHPLAAALRQGRPWLGDTGDLRQRRSAAAGNPWAPVQSQPSLLATPLTVQGTTIGALLLSRQGNAAEPFAADELQLAQDLADRAAVAIGNARLYQAAQLAIQTRDGVMASVSHDLRNPLSVIDGYAKLIRRRFHSAGAFDPVMVLDVLGRIERTTHRMNEMIDEIVDGARLDSGYSLMLAATDVDLVGLLHSLVAQYQTMTQKHTLRLTTPHAELHGTYDRPRLERVISNLLANAIKYSPAGGPIEVEVVQQDVDGAPWAVIAVSDHGMGIPSADVPKIFQRFHRAGNVGAVAGTGLGLSGARQILEQHGGTIAVASTPGSGSTFTIRLPLAPHTQNVAG